MLSAYGGIVFRLTKESSAQMANPDPRSGGRWFEGARAIPRSERANREEHNIASPLPPEHLEQFAGLPPGDHLDKPE
jgi:hypothetical protein